MYLCNIFCSFDKLILWYLFPEKELLHELLRLCKNLFRKIEDLVTFALSNLNESCIFLHNDMDHSSEKRYFGIDTYYKITIWYIKCILFQNVLIISKRTFGDIKRNESIFMFEFHVSFQSYFQISWMFKVILILKCSSITLKVQIQESETNLH